MYQPTKNRKWKGSSLKEKHEKKKIITEQHLVSSCFNKLSFCSHLKKKKVAALVIFCVYFLHADEDFLAATSILLLLIVFLQS